MMRIILLATLVVGCGTDSSSPSRSLSAKENEPSLVGIWPKDWTCDHIASPEEIGQILAGTARALDTPAATPDGVPRPCNYLVDTATGTEAWTFDLDCRDGYLQRAEKLFTQYEQTSADMVQQYNVAADAAPIARPGPKKHDTASDVDAPPPGRIPEASHVVSIGARGLDHHGQGLLFIDDDAPCYVRIVGPDADRRLALARHVAGRLNLANAPMTPRAAP